MSFLEVPFSKCCFFFFFFALLQHSISLSLPIGFYFKIYLIINSITKTKVLIFNVLLFKCWSAFSMKNFLL